MTPLALIEKALAIAAQPGVIFYSFGDMLRVPGSDKDLFRVKAEGGDVRVVYSPLDALQLARRNPGRQVVFFGIGFETTAPANATAVHQARLQGITIFSMLVSHVLVPPVIEAIMNSPTCRVQAFLAAGHVCSAMGYWQYYPLVERYRVPIVITGFEPLDLLEGSRRTVELLEAGTSQVENAYKSAVSFEGNQPAQRLLSEVFEVTDRSWRGIGTIPMSGWKLSDAYRDFDAEVRFAVTEITAEESPLCHSGEVLQGNLKPNERPGFGKECTPRHPLRTTMVSSEGAYAAYFRSTWACWPPEQRLAAHASLPCRSRNGFPASADRRCAVCGPRR